MPKPRETVVLADDFIGAYTLTTTPSGGVFGWNVADTSAAGTPTYATKTAVATGAMELLLAATSEAENVCMYQNDILSIDIDNILYVKFIAQVAGVNSVTTIVFGLASARNDTPDTVASNIWFRMEGSASTSNVVVETDDGTRDNDDKATDQTLSNVDKAFVIDFSEGKKDVRFFMGDADGHLVRVASGTKFDVSDITGSLQLLAQIQKASGTGTPSILIDRVELAYKR